jgi:hypothetical protein
MHLVVTMLMDVNTGETEDREIARFNDANVDKIAIGTVLDIDDHLAKVVGIIVNPAENTFTVKLPRDQAWIDELVTPPTPLADPAGSDVGGAPA